MSLFCLEDSNIVVSFTRCHEVALLLVSEACVLSCLVLVGRVVLCLRAWILCIEQEFRYNCLFLWKENGWRERV